jgi:hypothetical protein
METYRVMSKPIEDVLPGSDDGTLRYSELKAKLGGGSALLELPQRQPQEVEV